MAGTKAGGAKASATNRARYGESFYKVIGRKGGQNGNTGGFASDPELARRAGRKGGKISRRGPARRAPYHQKARTSSFWTLCGYADLDGDCMNAPAIQWLTVEHDECIEITGRAWWNYHYQGLTFKALPPERVELDTDKVFKYLPLKASKRTIEKAEDEIALYLWSAYRGHRMPQRLQVERMQANGIYYYRLAEPYGTQFTTTNHRLEEQ